MPKGARGGGRGGRKVGGGGKSRCNKDHRGLGLKHRDNKGRWDDIVARQLQPDLISKVLAEKTQPDPDLPGLGQHYCMSCWCVRPPVRTRARRAASPLTRGPLRFP